MPIGILALHSLASTCTDIESDEMVADSFSVRWVYRGRHSETTHHNLLEVP